MATKSSSRPSPLAPGPLIRLIAFLLGSFLCTCAAQGKPISDEKCQTILKTWLNQLGSRLDSDTSSVPLNWVGLDGLLRAESCRYDVLWVELWTVSHLPAVTPAKAKEFRSPSYFDDKPYLCKSLDEDVFVHHSTQSHNSSYEDSGSRFKHVVEPEYFFRLCPCGKRTFEHKCDCDYNESNEPYCSPVHNAGSSLAPDAKVFEWCLPQAPKENYEVQRAAIGPPAVAGDCSSLNLEGTVASCTPVQDSYDRVQITLHKVNNSVAECDFNQHHLQETAEYYTGNLRRVNETHGKFEIEVRNFEAGSTYCMSFKLLDHPYCQNRAIGLHQTNLAQPAVCSTHVRAPIRTPDGDVCGEAYGAGIPNNQFRLAMILFVILAVALLTLGSACYCYLRKKKRSSSHETFIANGNKPLLKNHEPMPSRAKASLLLLHAPSNTPSSFNDLNVQLRSWLKSIADENEEVYDLSDENHLEAIARDQEQWVTGIMSNPETRIVVVNSPSSVQLLTEKSSSESEGLLEGDDGEDPLRDLRRFAFKRLQSHFDGKYRQVLLVSYKELKPITKDLENLTPNRQCLLIPEQLSEVSSWVRNLGHGSSGCPSGNSTSGSQSVKIESEIRALCSKLSEEINSIHVTV